MFEKRSGFVYMNMKTDNEFTSSERQEGDHAGLNLLENAIAHVLFNDCKRYLLHSSASRPFVKDKQEKKERFPTYTSVNDRSVTSPKTF